MTPFCSIRDRYKNIVRIFAYLCFLISSIYFFSPTAYSIDAPGEMLPNPAQEKRAEKLGGQLRCPVCQNESIEDSSSDLAKDLRHVVREHIIKGESDEQIIHWMVSRYGNFIRLSPSFSLGTFLLWGMPFACIIGGVFICVYFYKTRKTPPLLPLTEEEKNILSALSHSSKEQP